MAKNTMYVSELDQFLTNLMKQKPELTNLQQQLRNTWWDREDIDQEEQKNYQESSAPKPAYAYFDYSSNAKNP